MAIRTKEQLLDKVDNEMSWRLKEIHDLKVIASSSFVSKLRKKVLFRTGVALLYAHWEGFIKCTGSYYLEYVSFQRLPINKLKNNFVTLIYKNKIDESYKSGKYSILDPIIETLIDKNTTRAKVPFKSIVQTKSNLSSVVLKEIIWCLGFDYSNFATKEYFIDSRLVSKRNHVAHGESMPISETEFIDMVDGVLTLLRTFKTEIENSAMLETYKKANKYIEFAHSALGPPLRCGPSC